MSSTRWLLAVFVMVISLIGCGNEASAPLEPGKALTADSSRQIERDATMGQIKNCYSLPEPERSECLRNVKGDD